MRELDSECWLSVTLLTMGWFLIAGCNKPTDGGSGAARSTQGAPSAPVAAAVEAPRTEITLASEQNHPFSVVVNRGYVYWASDDLDHDSGSVLRMPVNGGTPPTVIASHQYELIPDARLAVYGDNVYWIRTEGTYEEHDNSRTSVVTAPVGGGPVRRMASAGILTGALVVDGSGVFWTSARDGAEGQGPMGALQRVPLIGGKVATIALEPTNGEAADVLLDAQYVYWNQVDFRPRPGSELQNHVVRAPRVGGPAVELAGFGRPSAGIHALAVDDSFVYVADAGNGKGVGSIIVVPKGGGAARKLANVARPWAIAVDGDYVYVVSNSERGTIARISKASGDVLALATDQPNPGSIAVDDTFVYWSNFGEGRTGAIKKIRK